MREEVFRLVVERPDVVDTLRDLLLSVLREDVVLPDEREVLVVDDERVVVPVVLEEREGVAEVLLELRVGVLLVLLEEERPVVEVPLFERVGVVPELLLRVVVELELLREVPEELELLLLRVVVPVEVPLAAERLLPLAEVLPGRAEVLVELWLPVVGLALFVTSTPLGVVLVVGRSTPGVQGAVGRGAGVCGGRL